MHGGINVFLKNIAHTYTYGPGYRCSLAGNGAPAATILAIS